MYKLTKGEIINSETEAIVNTVNTEGVMGKGIALEFKEVFPMNYKKYREACKKGEVIVGKMFVTETDELTNPKFIINFPTKKEWRYPSRIEYIKEGLKDLRNVISNNNIKSISIPPLGCGNGKLNWNDVKPLIIDSIKDLQNVEVVIFEPSTEVYKEKINRVSEKKLSLNPTRALILSALNRYLILGYELSLLEAQKVVYFLQRFGEDLKLKYEVNQYGPYAKNFDYLLNYLEGHYITGMKHKNIRPFEQIDIISEKLDEINNYVEEKCSQSQKDNLKKVYDLIEGFESPLGMELLATVDYVMLANMNARKNNSELISKIYNWSTETAWNERKRKQLKERYIDLAIERLNTFEQFLYK